MTFTREADSMEIVRTAATVSWEQAVDFAARAFAATGVPGSNHYGAAGCWARLALRRNMGGFAFSSALASIAPGGGREPLVGNNPPAWAIPTRVVGPDEPLPPGETDPLFLDIALSVVA